MIGVIVGLVFIIGSICSMIGALLMNQMNPNYGSALAVPVYNAFGIILALLGLGISALAYKKNTDMVLAKRTMILGIISLVVLVLLFPLSNSGSLSLVR